MARIPAGEGLGQVVAQPARSMDPGRGAFGAPVADAVAAIGSDMVQTEDQNARIAKHEAEQAQRESVAEGRRQMAIRDAADRADAVGRLHATQEDLAALHDDVAGKIVTGELDKTKAPEEWGRLSKDLTTKALEAVPQAYKAQIQRDLDLRSARLARGVQGAVVKRDQADVRSGIAQTLEYAQRLHTTDPAKAEQIAMSALQQLGPHGGLDAAAITNQAQKWKEGAQGLTARAAVNGALGNLAALDKAEKAILALPSIDPNTQEQQLQRIAIERTRIAQQAEVAAARNERLRERQLREAQSAAQAVQAMADKGTMLDPAMVDQALETAKGTPWAKVIAEAAKMAATTGGMAALPLARQADTLRQVDAYIATNGRNEELDKRRDQLAKVHAGAVADLQNLGGFDAYAKRATGFVPAPLDMSGGLQTIIPALAERVKQAAEVSQWSGRPESPVRPHEAARVGELLQALPIADRTRALAVISEAVPASNLQALAQQIDSKDRPLALQMAMGASKTTAGKYAGEWVARGAQALKDKTVKEDTAAGSGLRYLLATEVGDAISGPARDDVIDAARLIYLGKEAAGEPVDEGNAVRLALGGAIVEHNGKRIPVPAGVDSAVLRDRLKAYPAEAIAAQAPDGVVILAGGKTLPIADLVKGLPAATLEPAGMGRYMIRSGAGLVMNSQRRPVIIEVPR